MQASPEREWRNAVLKPLLIRRLVRPIRAALAVIGRASSLGVTGIIPHTPEHQNGPGLSALIRGTAQNTTRIFPSAAQRLGLHTAGLVCTMRAANGLPHGEASTQAPARGVYLACDNTPRTARMQQVARATPWRRRHRAAVKVVAATGGVRRAPRGPPARTLSRARIGRSREAATLLHVAVPLCSETQTSEVWIASSHMRTGGRPMCSGASSFIW